jgi:hypothetical protein
MLGLRADSVTQLTASPAAAVGASQCAGFLPNDPEYASLLKEARVDVPALFITGHADALIPPHRTKVGVVLLHQAAACNAFLQLTMTEAVLTGAAAHR